MEPDRDEVRNKLFGRRGAAIQDDGIRAPVDTYWDYVHFL
jgi:hypothetical protein